MRQRSFDVMNRIEALHRDHEADEFKRFRHDSVVLLAKSRLEQFQKPRFLIGSRIRRQFERGGDKHVEPLNLRVFNERK